MTPVASSGTPAPLPTISFDALVRVSPPETVILGVEADRSQLPVVSQQKLVVDPQPELRR